MIPATEEPQRISVVAELFLLCMSLPSSFCVSPPPLLFLPFPPGSGAKVGRRTEANTAQGRAEGDPKAGELIMWLCVSRRPSVTLCTDRRTHASRRGLWEGGVALRGCALLLSFPFFPPSRPSSTPVLRPSPPLTYRLQTLPILGTKLRERDREKHTRTCTNRLVPRPLCLPSIHPVSRTKGPGNPIGELPLWIFDAEATWMLSLGLR
ncbi:uncharacterized protein ABDE67_008269 [Symphorus nematophorus]